MDISDERFLRTAIDLAQFAREKGEDPFGAVLVYEGNIVHKAYDRSIKFCDPTYHAEIGLISDFCRQNHKFSLEGYILYSSTEPCVMCAGAIKWSRISKVVFSVSQNMLQQITGGKIKPTCDNIVNTGQRKIVVMGPLIPEVGLKVFDGYKFLPKSERFA